jgi:hypothetical protein
LIDVHVWNNPKIGPGFIRSELEDMRKARVVIPLNKRQICGGCALFSVTGNQKSEF